MSLRINNISDQAAQNQLRGTSAALAKTLEKFATGRRINRAADDASGMVISDALRSQARGLGQAMRNANDGIAMIQIADSALSESTNLIQNIRTKALQAANASQSTESRQAIQADIDKMVTNLRDISTNTTYNGQQLLSGQFSNKVIQIGSDAGQTIALSVGNTAPETLGDPSTGTMTDINVTSGAGVQAALNITDNALAQVNSVRAGLGASQNQLSSSIENLSVTSINIQAAESQIGDADFAEESMMLSKMKVLSQAQAFATAQAGKVNQQQMMGLLQG